MDIADIAGIADIADIAGIADEVGGRVQGVTEVSRDNIVRNSHNCQLS